jgi:hypothetical protein
MSSDQLAQQCATQPQNPSISDLGEMAKQMFGNSAAMTQGCDMTSYYAALAGKGSVGPMGLGGSASFAGQMNGLKKSGCQTIAASLGNFLNACYQAKCIINNDKTSQTTTVTGLNSVNIVVSGGSTAYNTNCPGGTTINQTSNVSAKIITSISTTASNAIQSVVNQAQQTTAQQLAKIADGYQGTGSGAQIIQGLQQKVTNQDQATGLNNAIKTLNTTISSGNTVDYKVLANSSAINVFPCTITQDTLMNVQIASLISAAYSQDFKNSITAFSESTMGQTASVIAEGAPNVVGDFVKNNMMYIIGIVVVVILGFFVMKFMKSKQGQALMSKGMAKLSKGSGGGTGSGGGVGGLESLAKIAAFRRRRY